MSDQMIGAAAAAKRFVGGRAANYEARRSVRPFWAKEHAAVEKMLSGLPRGALVLDIPVGTGRYAPIYKKLGFKAVGIDASEDMLAEARTKVIETGADMDLYIGDALNIRHMRGTFHAVVCTRLVNWFLPAEMARAVAEMVRVMHDRLIISVEFGARKSEEGNNPHEPAVWAAALKAAGVVERRRIEISPGYDMIEVGR
jgi:ubiquinone/menaquinone biosynthesis C-methylase UbiE